MAEYRDLGRLDGAVLVFGGTYSNLQATEAVLAEADRLGIPPARMIHTGDVVAYGADAEATATRVRDSGVAVVMGNCEESLAADSEDCGCGFTEGSRCDLMAVKWYAHARAQLSAASRAWMATLPRRIDFSLGGRRFAVVHGAPSQINRFVFASLTDRELAAEIDQAGTDAVIGGHCGLPFIRNVGERLWLNAGAVGMPANDGTSRVWYALLAPRGEAVEIALRPLAYDHARAAAAMRAADLPGGYASALETGLWDSCDILPPVERAARGRAIEPTRHLWRGRRLAA
ncbi:MAG: metallophosphoesterase family protein [Alphaproteobacteria bacterium]|nr:metallophosphoesterase family protein [Alphaproteobacteria bacterium]